MLTLLHPLVSALALSRATLRQSRTTTTLAAADAVEQEAPCCTLLTAEQRARIPVPYGAGDPYHLEAYLCTEPNTQDPGLSCFLAEHVDSSFEPGMWLCVRVPRESFDGEDGY